MNSSMRGVKTRTSDLSPSLKRLMMSGTRITRSSRKNSATLYTASPPSMTAGCTMNSTSTLPTTDARAMRSEARFHGDDQKRCQRWIHTCSATSTHSQAT